MTDTPRILLIAFAVGVVSYFLGEAVFLLSLFGFICFLIYRNSDAEDRKFILTVLILAFLLRSAFAVIFHGANFLKGYHGISGDDLLYTVKSWGLVFKWEGKPYGWVADLASNSPKFGMNPFTYLLAFFYKVFGFHPVSSKLINCIIGTLIGWVAYLLGSEMFDRRTARISMFIVIFYPSIMRWSIANLKDPLIMLLFMVCAYILITASKRRIELWKVLLLVFSAWLLYDFTPRLYFILIAVCLGLLGVLRLFEALRSQRTRVAALAVAALILFAALYYFCCVDPASLIKAIYVCEEKQGLMAKADYAGYYFYSGRFMENLSMGVVSMPEFINIVYKSVVYFMLTPLPWQFTSPERLLAFPQMALWYLMLFLSFFGFLKLSVRCRGASLMAGALLAIGITASAMAEGNIGSAFRHRDMFTPFFAIFSAAIISDLIPSKGTTTGAGV